ENMRMLLRNWRRNRGAQVLPERDREAPEPLPVPADDWLGATSRRAAPRSINPLCEEYARRLVDLACASGVRIVWLLPPLSPAQQAARERDGTDVYFTRLARAVQRRGAGVVVIDARSSKYPRSAFWDDVHLNRRGALTLSLDVA